MSPFPSSLPLCLVGLALGAEELDLRIQAMIAPLLKVLLPPESPLQSLFHFLLDALQLVHVALQEHDPVFGLIVERQARLAKPPGRVKERLQGKPYVLRRRHTLL